MTILIDLELFDSGPSRTATTGATISHFYWKYIPVVSQSGINVQPGTSTELGLTTQIVETTEVARRRFTPEERQCYFEDEIRMVRDFLELNRYILLKVNCNPDVGCMYEYSNCLNEAFTDKVYKQCTADNDLKPRCERHVAAASPPGRSRPRTPSAPGPTSTAPTMFAHRLENILRYQHISIL